MTTKTALNPVRETLKLGQSLWYDGLIAPEDLQKMIREDGLRGATTNPTIFEKALSGTAHDIEVKRLLKEGHSEESVYQTIAIRTVQQVADVFLPVYEESRGTDGFVSMEVSPLLAYDTAATAAEAKDLYRRLGRKNVMIKIPATREGIPAVEETIAEGISVNVTLIFSIERYLEVMAAYAAGIEKRLSRNESVAEIASVASFFVSRVDSMVDKKLEEKIRSGAASKNLLGQAAVANAKAAYAEFERFFFSARWEKIRAAGAQIQRPLWASTGTKNPAYSDVLYVESLIGAHTVNTMPPATLDAFRHHGVAASHLTENQARAAQVLKEVSAAGIDLNEVTEELEKAGVVSFKESYLKIIECIGAKK